MSWLISLLIAGAMLSAENNLPAFQTSNYTETPAATVVKADESERFEQTYPLTANGRISVSNVNGSITIEGWDRNEVKLEYVKTAETKERLADAQVRIDAQRDSLRVEAEYNYSWNRTNGDNGSWKNKGYKGAQVEFRLMVPRAAVLNEIETVNGSVNVSNTTNSARISTVNGEVKAANISGTANLSTVNGTVTADFERLASTDQIKLETVNGQAFLTIPSDADATIRAETTNGKITNEFGLPVRRGKFVGNSLYGRIGGGNVRISLESVNGELSLRRKQDGKNPNPVTNLLGSKTDDDDDDAVISGADKKAMKELSKVRMPEVDAEVQKAMADAQKELANAQVKVNINQAALQETVRRAMEQQRVAMQNMRDAGWFSGMPRVERKSESFAVKGKPNVTIDAKDCAVFVRGWDKPEVGYSLVRISRNAQLPAEKDSAVSVKNTDSQIDIKVSEDTSGAFNDAMQMRLEVNVPRQSNLQITTDHEVRLENVSGDLHVRGGEESIDVRDSSGSLNIAATDGRVRVIGFQGAVSAETNDGLMTLEGNFQALSARTADGTIILTLPENANAMIESNRDEISGEGVSLVRQSSGKDGSMWKIGGGGQSYSLNSNEDGKIFVRGANAIKTN